MSERVELYRDKAGDYRWCRIADNGETVSESGEGYRSKRYAVGIARRLNPGVAIFEIEVRAAEPTEKPDAVG